jgi:hypothetical protein
MTFKQIGKLMPGILVFCLPLVAGAEVGSGADWHARTLGGAVVQTVVFALVGVGLAIVGYKLFDLATPGKLHQEILENKNLAAGLVGAAIILGVCILVAVAMLG